MEAKTNKQEAKRELNNLLKEEYKSFSVLRKVLEAKRESEAMKEYLNAYSLTFEKLVDMEYLKGGLTFATFTASNGTTYEAPSRKGKDGEVRQAKWSFWLILSAAAKVRKEELKKEFAAKEKSLQAIEEEASKQEESKQASKKKASKKG